MDEIEECLLIIVDVVVTKVVLETLMADEVIEGVMKGVFEGVVPESVVDFLEVVSEDGIIVDMIVLVSVEDDREEGIFDPFRVVVEEIEIDDIESPMRQNQEPVISSAPSRRIHPGTRRIGADQKRHSMTIAANVWSRFPVIIAINVKEFEPLLCPIRDNIAVRPLLRWWIRNAQQEFCHVIAFSRT